jgi:type IV pilus biogenesis protein CpaD/CtpE
MKYSTITLLTIAALTLAGCAPASSSKPAAAPAVATAQAAEVILAKGDFANAEAPTSGTAQLVKKADGKVYVQLKNFKVEAAPDLYVWLYEGSSVKKGDSPTVGKGKYVEVAKLAGLSGNFEYAVPANTDLAAYKSVVIWCKQFTVAMGAAPLN